MITMRQTNEANKREGETMPTYKLLRNTIEITSEVSDAWKGTTTGDKAVDGLLICGRVTHRASGNDVMLKLRLSDKPDLQQLLQELEANRQARRDRINSIPGLADLRQAAADYQQAQSAYDRASECGYPLVEAEAARKADDMLADLRSRYPDASAYLRAEGWADYAANYAKAAAGRRAVERIEDGEDIATVITEMESEWSAAASQAVDNN